MDLVRLLLEILSKHKWNSTSINKYNKFLNNPYYQKSKPLWKASLNNQDKMPKTNRKCKTKVQLLHCELIQFP